VRFSIRAVPGRAFGPLHISIAEPEQANILIDSNLIWNCQLHNCEPFSGECQVTQCFRCYSYGHIAKLCRNSAQCGYCAALNHQTNDCKTKEDRAGYRCVPFAGKHPSWSQDCPQPKNPEGSSKSSALYPPNPLPGLPP
jgi:hypothetical protein